MKTLKNARGRFRSLYVVLALSGALPVVGATPDVINEPYRLDTGLESRSISFENPTGARGAGGQAASRLGVGRKGSPARTLQPGETVRLCDIEGRGTIRHIWVTTSREPDNLRSLVVRAYWDGQEHPSIECPLGDFMGFAHGKVMAYESAVHTVGQNAGMSIWLPMPFTKRARWTMTNEGERITIQQIGWKDGLYERQDDWSCATFWYEPVPSAALPAFPDRAARTADLWVD